MTMVRESLLLVSSSDVLMKGAVFCLLILTIRGIHDVSWDVSPVECTESWPSNAASESLAKRMWESLMCLL
ncbi:hypothetical protein DFJ43DRAFT_1104648 [Lentinula guzmanii]|uniref:Uncharacterized protein n=1 Tax=Lentinula guzmanii TaxID=2804957 RepID=A0AA38MUW3_9AGAR|nr:hypothetical protein DFJ43DRAFT_1104648 [Lentinula guzmanii]